MAAGGGEAKRAFEAMMTMRKIDIAAIQAVLRICDWLGGTPEWLLDTWLLRIERALAGSRMAAWLRDALCVTAVVSVAPQLSD